MNANVAYLTSAQHTQSPSLTPEERQAKLALEEQTYAIAFETFLEQIAAGNPLDRAIREYHTPIVPAKFRSWVYRDPKRKQAYMVAKAIGAEAVEDELIRIADGLDPTGNPTLDDVQRSTLKINTRKWLLGVWNRKRYGETKQINTQSTTTIDVAAMTSEEINRKIMEAMGVQLDPNAANSTIFDNDDPFMDAP